MEKNKSSIPHYCDNKYIDSENREFFELAYPVMDYIHKKYGSAAFQYEVLITEDSARVMQTYLGTHIRREIK